MAFSLLILFWHCSGVRRKPWLANTSEIWEYTCLFVVEPFRLSCTSSLPHTARSASVSLSLQICLELSVAHCAPEAAEREDVTGEETSSTIREVCKAITAYTNKTCYSVSFGGASSQILSTLDGQISKIA